jgi:hypothetical protein
MLLHYNHSQYVAIVQIPTAAVSMPLKVVKKFAVLINSAHLCFKNVSNLPTGMVGSFPTDQLPLQYHL